MRVTRVAPLATQGLFSWPPRPLARPGALEPFLSRPTPAVRGTILKFVCSNEERAARRVCVSGDEASLGGCCADLGAVPRLRRGAVREIELSWALQLSTKISHRFAPSATVGESGVFSLTVLL